MFAKKKRLRAAFVVTVSATAVAACGGKTNETDGTSDVRPGGGVRESSNPPRPLCRAGAACLPSESCSNPKLECVNGTWRAEIPVHTNPPPPQCGDDVHAGESCSALPFCLGPDSCGDRPPTAPPQRRFFCMEGVWRWQEPYTLPCPALAPNHGDDCSACEDAYPESCMYAEQGPCALPLRATCTNGTWKTVFQGTCNPPPPDAGP
jgi:hypothetical protein